MLFRSLNCGAPRFSSLPLLCFSTVFFPPPFVFLHAIPFALFELANGLEKLLVFGGNPSIRKKFSPFALGSKLRIASIFL